LGQAPGERSFASLGVAHRLAPGLALPTPVGIFPRHVDAGAEGGSKASKKPNA
jgi:hypothetical protein